MWQLQGALDMQGVSGHPGRCHSGPEWPIWMADRLVSVSGGAALSTSASSHDYFQLQILLVWKFCGRN